MFNLDILLFSYLYGLCKSLGGALGYGAFEGFILYSGMATLGIFTVSNINSKKVKK